MIIAFLIALVLILFIIGRMFQEPWGTYIIKKDYSKPGKIHFNPLIRRLSFTKERQLTFGFKILSFTVQHNPGYKQHTIFGYYFNKTDYFRICWRHIEGSKNLLLMVVTNIDGKHWEQSLGECKPVKGNIYMGTIDIDHGFCRITVSGWNGDDLIGHVNVEGRPTENKILYTVLLPDYDFEDREDAPETFHVSIWEK